MTTFERIKFRHKKLKKPQKKPESVIENEKSPVNGLNPYEALILGFSKPSSVSNTQTNTQFGQTVEESPIEIRNIRNEEKFEQFETPIVPTPPTIKTDTNLRITETETDTLTPNTFKLPPPSTSTEPLHQPKLETVDEFATMLQQNALALDSDISTDSDNEDIEIAEMGGELEQSSIKSDDDIQGDEESLAEIYEILQKKQAQAIVQQSNAEHGDILLTSRSKKRYSHVKSRVFDHLNKSSSKPIKAKKEQMKSKTPRKREERAPRTRKIDENKSRMLDQTVSRLYTRHRLNKHDRGHLKREDEREYTFKPKLNRKSLTLAKNRRKNELSYKNIHQKLFYKGLEDKRSREEAAEVKFSKIHPFQPNLHLLPDKDSENLRIYERSKSRHRGDANRHKRSKSARIVRVKKSKISDMVTPKQAEIIYQKFMKQEKLKQTKLDIIRSIEGKYDPETGQKLYKPLVDSRRHTQKIISRYKSRPDLKTQEYFIKDCTEFMKKCRQIFEFLDVDNECTVYSAKLNSKTVHPKTFKLISCILVNLIKYESMEGPGLPFPLFYKMIRENELEQDVMDIFFAIEAQPEGISLSKGLGRRRKKHRRAKSAMKFR